MTAHDNEERSNFGGFGYVFALNIKPYIVSVTLKSHELLKSFQMGNFAVTRMQGEGRCQVAKIRNNSTLHQSSNTI